MTAVASASISSCSITCSAWRITSVESAALSASSTSSRADWSRAIVWFSFESSLVGSYEASRGGPPNVREPDRELHHHLGRHLKAAIPSASVRIMRVLAEA